MRDADRIPEICQLLAEEWAKRPQHRFGQFLLNYIFHVPAKADLSMWLQEDTITKKRLESWEQKAIERLKEQKSITDSFGTSGE